MASMVIASFGLALRYATAFPRPDHNGNAGGRAWPQTKPHRIDVHHHHASPAFVAEIKALQTGQHALMQWSPAQSIEEMDRAGVQNPR